jgi:glycosyltransferase involved in cell wall biosynthesis
VPGLLRRLDGLSIALACRGLVKRLAAEGRADLLDVHFGYPEGHAGCLLARWCRLPFVVTLRGKEARMSREGPLRTRMQCALREAAKVISVSQALRELGIELGARPEDSVQVGNGIDLDKFHPLSRADARRQLGIEPDRELLVSVGNLSERKGFHRVIECLPGLLETHPRLLLLIVGGPSLEGDWTERLHRMVKEQGLESSVRFLGPMAPQDLKVPLSAADVFVLATRYEGWANVFLEAMACGLPVVTTRVGGNAEVLSHEGLGILVPFDDNATLAEALHRSLITPWDRAAIRAYAEENTWDRRIAVLVALFGQVHEARAEQAREMAAARDV